MMWLHLFGRLKPGVTLAQAESQANTIFQAGLESFYGAYAAGDRRAEYLDQRLLIHPAAGGASSSRAALSDLRHRAAWLVRRVPARRDSARGRIEPRGSARGARARRDG